ncbi:MAG: DUF1800 domain-containing protein [Acidobacteriota bacterium]|nr:MAG: DUF1800 domain-containing protein [Acidobacteriota bacterium]
MRKIHPANRFATFLAILSLFTTGFPFGGTLAALESKTLREDQKALHVLNRLGFGPRPGDVEKVRAMGISKYIESQLDPRSIDDRTADQKLARLDVLKMDTVEIFAKYPNPGALLQMLEGGRNASANSAENGNEAEMRSEQQQRRAKLAKVYAENGFRPANRIMFEVETSRILRAAYSERQLEEVMVDFWANHFNVFSGKAATRWYIPAYERDVIRKHALGNFKDLVMGTAKHPAMLFYLDNFQSVAPNAGARNGRQGLLGRAVRDGRLDPRVRERLKARGLSDEQIDQRIEQAGAANRRGINENYARELMELHTLGVDGGYTQKDIQEVARAFTGWTIFDARGYRRAAAQIAGGREDQRIVRQARQLGLDPDTPSGSFVFAGRLHDDGPKMVLGQKIDEGGIKDGEKVIDILVSHPSTSRYIARKLAVKFVNDKPDEALVERVAKAFRDSKGDIKSTLRALFYDDQFFAPENYRAKIKTPFELLVSSLRAVDAQTVGSRQLNGLLRRMGEPLYGYQAPTGYPDSAEDWVNTGALLERMNFAVALASGMIPQVRVDLKRYGSGGKDQILDKAIEGILAGEVSDPTRAVLLKQMEQPLPEVSLDAPDEMDLNDGMAMRRNGIGGRRTGGEGRMRSIAPTGDPDVFKAVGLILGSPEFQRQ